MMLRRLALATLFFGAYPVTSQSIMGTWRLIDLPACYSNKGLFAHIATATGEFSYGLTFDEGNSGREGLAKASKLSRSKKILYRVEGQTLFILDPKVQLIEGSYIITTLTADTLILVNPKKSCEEFSFTRLE